MHAGTSRSRICRRAGQVRPRGRGRGSRRPGGLGGQEAHRTGTTKHPRLLGAGADPLVGKTDNGCTPAYIAALKGHAEVLQLLVASGANVNTAKTTDGATPVYIAAENGHAAAVRLLLEARANPSTPRPDGVTPLKIAEQRGHAAVVALLKQHGAQ